MITIKTPDEIKKMRIAGRISAQALKIAGEMIKPGISTKKIDEVVHDFIISQGAIPNFLNYGGYPASTCISINNVVVHGIPSEKIIINDGDIVSIDVGACINGYHGDNAYTFACGNISKKNQRLLEITKESLQIGIDKAIAGNKIGDIGYAIQTYVEANGFSVVRNFVGHGIGKKMHEDPQVPNYGEQNTGISLSEGMVIAIEPMVNIGNFDVEFLNDGWSTITKDRKNSAHFEHTVAITKDGPVILTDPS